MQLPIVISAILVVSFGLNTAVMSQPPVETAQTRADTNSSNIAKFRINRRLWRRQNISNYHYAFTRSCFCFPKATEPVVIEVRNGATTSITFKDTGKPADAELFQKYNTIPKLFELIRDAIARRASNLTVEYDNRLGYPTQISIDYKSEVSDDQLFITIENLEKIE